MSFNCLLLFYVWTSDFTSPTSFDPHNNPAWLRRLDYLSQSADEKSELQQGSNVQKDTEQAMKVPEFSSHFPGKPSFHICFPFEPQSFPHLFCWFMSKGRDLEGEKSLRTMWQTYHHFRCLCPWQTLLINHRPLSCWARASLRTLQYKTLDSHYQLITDGT